jgi:chemotaxis protein MotA
MSVTKEVFRRAIGTLKAASIDAAAYEELLKVLYKLAQIARRDGFVALKQHFENPTQSSILNTAPILMSNHHAVAFLCDTLRTVSIGVDAHDLEELMEKDLETIHHDELRAPAALTSLSDSLPGLGIVAAVLGVVITMGKIDQPPAVIGHSVAAALVGTFIGILLCYGFVGPLAKNIEHRIQAEGRYLLCIKTGVLALAKGTTPGLVIEYARRAIDLENRPTFSNAEAMVKSQ